MSGEEFDRMIRNTIKPVSITDDRAERVIAAVLDQSRWIPQQSRTWARWRWVLWPRMAPTLQFALPMLVAAVLGMRLGNELAGDGPLVQFSSLLLSSGFLPAGS